MNRFLVKLWLALHSKKGQSLVEYALILALVAIVVIAALTALGGEAANKMDQVSDTPAPKRWRKVRLALAGRTFPSSSSTTRVVTVCMGDPSRGVSFFVLRVDVVPRSTAAAFTPQPSEAHPAWHRARAPAPARTWQRESPPWRRLRGWTPGA